MLDFFNMYDIKMQDFRQKRWYFEKNHIIFLKIYADILILLRKKFLSFRIWGLEFSFLHLSF